MPQTTPRTALIVGATGGVGGETALALARHGWRVRALARDAAAARRGRAGPAVSEWAAGDAMSRADMTAAAEGAALIVHAANPPGYRNWRGLALPMLANAIAAARASGARLVLPGNVYNFGAGAPELVDEATPFRPTTRKGAVRVEMEAMLCDAAAEGVRSLVVRASDYFGPHAPGSWFSNVMVRPGQTVRAVTDPGDPAVGHSWAYLPDLGEAIARLAGAENRLADAEVVHFAGHWLGPGQGMAQAIRRAVGDPELPVRRFPWPLVGMARPFVRLFREVWEMRYLWREPLRLDNARLEALIGPEPRTPVDIAVRETLAGLGCLPAAAAPEPRLVEVA